MQCYDRSRRNGSLALPITFNSLANPQPNAEALENVFAWLERNGLTHPGGIYEADLSADGREVLSPETSVFGLPCRREERRKRDELDRIKHDLKEKFSRPLLTRKRDQIWNEVRHPAEAVRNLDLKRVPADAMAFYRRFHFPPFHQWGIYLIVPRLLDYHKTLQQSFHKVSSFTPETLAVCVLFEVFHHEFFHHLVEATATTMEILSAAFGRPRPIFMEYLDGCYEKTLGRHRHTPLEEALANAYAYNAFAFISRVKAGYVDGMVSVYQEAMKAYWPTEPEGYKYAEAYIKSRYVCGAAQLLSMLIGDSLPHGDEPLFTVARSVFPSGHTAFLAKPDIPTYLVGTPEELVAFEALVPAANETYTSLFWPGDTPDLDKFIQEKKRQEREARQQAREATKGTG